MTLKINRIVEKTTAPDTTNKFVPFKDPLKHITKQELNDKLDKLQIEYDLLKSLYDAMLNAIATRPVYNPWSGPWQTTWTNSPTIASTNYPSDPQYTCSNVTLSNNSVPVDAMPISDLTSTHNTQHNNMCAPTSCNNGNIQSPV